MSTSGVEVKTGVAPRSFSIYILIDRKVISLVQKKYLQQHHRRFYDGVEFLKGFFSFRRTMSWLGGSPRALSRICNSIPRALIAALIRHYKCCLAYNTQLFLFGLFINPLSADSCKFVDKSAMKNSLPGESQPAAASKTFVLSSSGFCQIY